jgi:hypothetical protein
VAGEADGVVSEAVSAYSFLTKPFRPREDMGLREEVWGTGACLSAR